MLVCYYKLFAMLNLRFVTRADLILVSENYFIRFKLMLLELAAIFSLDIISLVLDKPAKDYTLATTPKCFTVNELCL